MDDNVSDNPPATPPVPRRRARWWWLGAAGLAAAAALGVAANRAWHSPATLPWVLARVPGLQAEGVQGSLAGRDLRVQRLHWALPAGQGELTITGLALSGLAFQPRWQPALHGGTWAQLTVKSLRADTLHYRSGPPSPAPQNLRLPVQVEVDHADIGQLNINDLAAVSSVLGSAQLGADNGAHHRLQLRQARIEKAELSGTLQLGSDAPMPLTASLQAKGTAGPAWQAQLKASGPLARLQVEAQVSGEAPAGRTAPTAQASATVATWAAWPLAALQLRVRQFDLASLSDRLPETALDGQAQVQSTGLDQPADMQIQLRNARAGRFDQQRLPVSSLAATLVAPPAQPGHVDVRGLELQLADGSVQAGRITGQGQWRDGVAELALQLQDVQPARLDARSASVRATGTLTLRASQLLATAAAPAHPQFTVKAQLSGQAVDGRGVPLQLKLDADASADRVLLRQAEATAGDARASVTGLLQRAAGGWHGQGEARLDRFDPQPWWRGAEGSAWRQGPHRLTGQLKADLMWRGGGMSPSASSVATTAAWDSWLRRFTGTADLTLAPSVLAGQPLSGELHLASQASGLRLQGALQAAGNALTVDGQGGGAPANDHWQLQLQGPQLSALAPLWRLLNDVAPGSADWLPVAGQLEGHTVLDGRWPSLRTSGRLKARGWRSKSAQLARLDATWDAGDAPIKGAGAGAPPLAIKLDADGLVVAGQQLDHIEAQVSGTLADHRMRLLADSKLRPPAWTETLLGPIGNGTRLEAEGHGAWSATTASGARTDPSSAGRWRLDQLQLSGGARDVRPAQRPWLLAKDLVAELGLDAGGRLQALRLEPGRVQLLSTGLRWQQAEWRAGAAGGGADLLDVTAELDKLAVAGLLQKLQPAVGWSGDLTLAGRISIHQGAKVDADVVLERLAGDLHVTDELGSVQPLGLSELRLALSAHDGLWQFAEGFAGSQVGQVAGAQVIRSTPTARWPAAGSPLQGVLEARVANLGVWGLWVPPGWRLSGSLHTSASVAGSVGAPEFSGEMKGQGLGARNVLQGIVLSDGELIMSLTGERARIERLRFKGGDGTLEASGDATLGSDPEARLQVLADHFRLLGRIDRRVVASGRADVQLNRQRLKVDGKFTVDEGLFDISQGDAPSLDSDVVVIPRETDKQARAADERPAPAQLPAPLRNAEVTVAIDLGQALRLRGRGVDTGLRGELRVSSPGGQMSLNGTVRAHSGNYAAYGQKLEITRGEIVFSGAANNPRLDVLAVRPNIDAQVGVAITGNALSPRIRLHSEPELPEMDKLSWLVLGRAPDGLGRSDTALLQRAAVALLAGEGKAPTDELLGALGITDFSVRQTDGTVRETIVSLGRQLSRRWYVGYERSLNATTGTWQLIYRVAQRFTLRAQTGETTAFDMIWSWRFN